MSTRPKDTELSIMRSCCAYLEQLDEEQRARVLAYLTSRYSTRYAVATDEPLPGGATTAVVGWGAPVPEVSP